MGRGAHASPWDKRHAWWKNGEKTGKRPKETVGTGLLSKRPTVWKRVQTTSQRGSSGANHGGPPSLTLGG